MHSSTGGISMAATATAGPHPIDAPARQHLSIHGRSIAYCEYPGSGPVLLMIHGVGSNADCWNEVIPALVEGGAHVVAVDLPGHGQSGKVRGDYSLGAMANALRDLLDHLGHDRAVLVGHSLGGGIAMQFYYQFPTRVDGLVLVSSGGLGEETRPWLRAATLPGTEVVLSAIGSRATISSASWVSRRLSTFGVKPRILADDALTRLREFGDRDYRNAFLATLRSVVDISGQRVSALGQLSLARELPVLLIWGQDDPTIPLEHGHNANRILPKARLVVFEGAGHEPHMHDPGRFAKSLLRYLKLDVAIPVT